MRFVASIVGLALICIIHIFYVRPFIKSAPEVGKLLTNARGICALLLAVAMSILHPSPDVAGFMDGAGEKAAVSAYDSALDLYRHEKFEQAAAILEAALPAETGEAAGFHSLLGWCRYRLDRMEQARLDFLAALEMAPGNADALEGLARSAARLGRDSEALDAVLVLRRDHPAVEVADLAGMLLARTGQVRDRRLRGTSDQKLASAPRLIARAHGDYLEVREGSNDWRPLFVKGINLGAALPGKYPSQFPEDREVYAEWLRLMSDMGANVVRLYTLFPPAFYEALYSHNASRATGDGRIWLVQGVWTELPEGDDYDEPSFKGGFLEEIERVVDAVHGNIAVVHRRGHAHGLYETDVSRWTLAYILGREWEPYSVEAYDRSLPRPASFLGTQFTLENGTPMEAWIASVMDHAVGFETRSYSCQRPVAFTSWPTLDPLHHPTEATKVEEIEWLRKLGLPQEPGTLIQYDNDGVSIDASRIRATEATPAGNFASYHAYPYYPDFMNVDPGYLKGASSHGASSYIAYLRELRRHHEGMPLMIAEVGVPTSRGIAHHQPQGWHHGGHAEMQQGEIDARLMEEIHEARCAGGILFAWIDEWFKKNWLVIAFEVPWENNKNWLNILDPEQNYGLMAFKPGRDGWKIKIDGQGGDWKEIPAIAGDGSGPLRSLRVSHDEAYLYLRLDVDHLDYTRTQYVIGIDTFGAGPGDHLMPFNLGLTTPTGMEFVVDLAGPDATRLLCDVPYDLHINRFSRPWRSSRNEDGVFTQMLVETSRRRVGRDGTVFPAVLYSRSPLRHATMDPDSPDYDDLADWMDNPDEGFIEMRLGWNMLNVTDPSTRQVLDDPVPPRGGAGHSTTDGFRFYVAARRTGEQSITATLPERRDGELPSDEIPFYTWEPWEEPSYHSYLKKSYFILEERLGALEPLPSAHTPAVAEGGRP